ncbi:multicopper oxidase family protein [Microlunatus soli]|uniref:Spore coat protein A n=1 Tax=Microlunatus soli TaxID=630515 RepID=A0A1H1Y1Y1_9ACTN|nr:multicopper oxidase family protein [Microlunatus soli]SDT15425.1 spore coat protein A [Microlunatus soli]
MRRRTLLTAAGIGLAGAAVGGLAGCADSPADQTARLLPSTGRLPAPYQVPLPIPAIKEPVARRNGVTRYEIIQRTADVEILPGTRTTIMGYDGSFPGPTIRARRGERVVVRHRNRLPVPTVVHLHGGNTAAEDDGYPVDLVLPVRDADRFEHGGGSMGGGHAPMAMNGDVSHGFRDYHYDHDQQAATLWYHDHRMDFTGAQVWRGLAGFHLINDDVEDGLGLPHDERDIPLMLTDRSFAEDGSLLYPAADPQLVDKPGVTEDYASGVLGDVILVNGAPWPELEVEAARYRFRILNASNARRYQLQLDPPPPGGTAFTQVGSDAGLLAAPVKHGDLTIAAAERYDTIVDFSGYPVGTRVELRNALGSGRTAQVMRFTVARQAADDSTVPAKLAEIEPLNIAGAVHREWRFARKRTHGMTMWAINGKFFDPQRMDADPRLGRTEVWRFATDLHHPVHVHLSPFQVLSRNGHPPGPTDAGWKDTLDLRPTEYADVAIRFENHRGHYLMHCHNLEHEDMGMMSAFKVV